MIIFLSFCYDSYSDERLVSQETVLLHGCRSKTLNFGIKEVSKGQISTVCVHRAVIREVVSSRLRPDQH